MTKRQIDGFKKNPSKSIGCCTSCSKSIIMVTHGSPLANPEIYKKTKESLLKNHGVEHPAQSEVIKQKMRETSLKKYKVDNPFKSKVVQEKRKETNLKKYGVEHAIGSEVVRTKSQKTIREKYHVDNVFQSEEIKKRIKEKHLKDLGVDHPMKSKEVQARMRKTNVKNIGVEYPLQSPKVLQGMKRTNLSRYKVEYVVQCPELMEGSREKSRETTLRRHGVEYFCQHERCISASHKRISNLNKKFQKLLFSCGVESELEFVVENYGYDLRVGNFLIEINPSFTHNSTRGPEFGKKIKASKPFDYHLSKSEKAKENGFHCVHVFDWDDKMKVINLLKDKESVGARKCEVKEITKKEAKEFLDKYHIQGSTRSSLYAYGLFHEGELVQVMTFGKPRYNKKYEYELLRLCTKEGLSILGGASKLLSYFEKQVSPKSILSYCDLSKFSGEVYEKLGFTLSSQTPPAKHWYHIKTKSHITDNLLRQRGFDQLHKTSFGKGTSNEQLMLDHGYIEIYDCGQLVFTKILKSN